MSEYQYYEFQALDCPLSEDEMKELRSYSSRATITATRFVNSYSFGSFKGDPSKWMEKYFDAFLYLANWGTHELMLRFPRQVLDLATAKQYCRGESAGARAKGEHVILGFRSEDEEGEWVDEENGHLSALVSLRTDIANGDLRALYLAWLLCAQAGELADSETEPPCPPGLGKLTAPLEEFIQFFHLDRHLVEAAAARSPDASATTPPAEIKRWVAGLPEAEKTELLIRLMEGNEPHLRSELLRRFRDAHGAPSLSTAEKPRTVGELLQAAEERREVQQQRDSERAAREEARREREKAEARERYLVSLAGNEAEMWRKVEALIATKQPGKYEEAVKLLGDLRDLGTRSGESAEVESRIRHLCEEHAKKPSFIHRLRGAGLVETRL